MFFVHQDKAPFTEKGVQQAGCKRGRMRQGFSWMLTRVLTRVRTKLGGGGQATAMALSRAHSPGGLRSGAQEERKPFVLHHLQPRRPAKLVASRTPVVPHVRLRSQVQVRPARTAPPELPGLRLRAWAHHARGAQPGNGPRTHTLHGGEEEVLVASGSGGEVIHFGFGVGPRLKEKPRILLLGFLCGSCLCGGRHKRRRLGWKA